MSEIASKANSRPSSGLAQPLVKKGDTAELEMVFAALFGGVVEGETDDDLAVGGLEPVNAHANIDANPVESSDILVAMQAVAVMMSGQRGTGLKDGLSAESEKSLKDDSAIVDEDDIVAANLMMIGAMPLQQQAGTDLTAAGRSAVMAQMPFEDEAFMPHQQKSRAVLDTPKTVLHPAGAQSQMTPLPSSSSLQTIKSAEQQPSNVDPIDDMLAGGLDIEESQLRSDGRSNGRPSVRQATYQQNISQVSLANSKSAKGFDQALIDMDGDMQFDNPDDFTKVVEGQTERGVGRISSQSVSGESLSANAVRQMQEGGLSLGGQMSQQNNGQSGGHSGGQSGGLISASAGTTNGSMMEMLDLAQDNWTEMLLQRVEKGLSGGKDKIDFHLNPRNLGKMRITLVVQNERTNVHIQTETSAAAQLLSDAEARLAQMMDASGLKFGNLTSQNNLNFGGNFAGQNPGQGREDGSAHATTSANADGEEKTNVEVSVEQSENLINMQA